MNNIRKANKRDNDIRKKQHTQKGESEQRKRTQHKHIKKKERH